LCNFNSLRLKRCWSSHFFLQFFCTLQVVFDYMTTLGFSQNVYTLAWSHPRQPLDGDVDKTLQQLKFDTRMLLFVQEKFTDEED